MQAESEMKLLGHKWYFILPSDYIGNLRGKNTLSRESILSKLFCLPTKMGSTVTGKNLLPLGENSFLFEKTPARMGLVCKKANRKPQKLSPL